jgi:membrane associated rhomboid family serine protease
MEERSGRIRDSPSVWMAAILIVVYLVLGIAGGNLFAFNYDMFYPLAQVNADVWHGAVWMLFTSMFMHANLSHLGGNVLFLLIFGTSLEEQVTRKKWLTT